MRSLGILTVIIVGFIALAGCTQLPGLHTLANTPDPIIGQWIGGEPPASDLHVIFYENQTFLSTNFFLNRGEMTDSGTWMKKEPGHYVTCSANGNVTDWVYDSFDDSMYTRDLPQLKYYRYRG